MKRMAAVFLLVLAVLPEVCRWPAPAQDREHPLAGPTEAHWLGTDALGRDNLARYAAGARFSLGGGAVAAAVATAIGAAAGGGLSALPARGAFVVSAVFDAMHAVPWYLAAFLLRALVPLTAPPALVAAMTYGLLAGVGWVSTARVVAASLRELRPAPWARFAAATGVAGPRIVAVHLLPNLWPILRAQFLLLLPAMLLAEASLGLVGMGVPEPLPSLGGAIAELTQPGWQWWTAVPLVVLSVSVLAVQTLLGHLRPAPGDL